jgi:hypothetical protein
MRIHYKNKQIYINLILGIIWLINGIIQVGFNEKPNWFGYGWFVFSAIYLTIYFYQKNEKYLTIENGIIKQNWPFGKKMNLAEIKRIRHFAGDYILKTERTKMTINIQLVEEKSLADLKTELEKLNVEWH